jgi:mannose-1-phosphate guanylyltransferase
MRAILLAAGLGTRLRPLTDAIPKCLVPINGAPLLEIWLDRLTQAGVGPILLNTHYLAAQVQKYILTSRYRTQVRLFHEPKLLGTAGTLIKNLDIFQDDDGMLIHADNYCLADLTSFIDAHRHRPSGCMLTMMTFRTNTPSSCGIVEIDHKGVLTGFHEKVESPPGNLANGAIYILSSELLKELKRATVAPKDFSTEVVGSLIGKIYTYETPEALIDVGTPESYELVKALAENRISS